MVLSETFSSISPTAYRGYFYNLLGINDNIMMITMFNILCAMVITYIYNTTAEFNFSGIKLFLMEYCIRDNSIELEGDIFKKGKWESYTDFSEKTKGLLYHISTLEVENSNINHIKEIVHSNNRYQDLGDPLAAQRFTQYIVNQGPSFNLEEDIYCKVTTKSTLTEPEKKNDEKINYKRRIFSKKYSLEYLIIFLNKCEER